MAWRVVHWPTVRAWVSAAGGVAAAGATWYLARANLDPGFGNRGGQLIAIAVVGAVGVVSALARPLRVYFMEQYDRHQEKVSKAMRGLPWTVNALTHIDVKPLGASAWVVRGWTIEGWRPRRKLHRLARERVNDMPAPSGITWTKGKGVIGRCWETGQAEVHDAGSLHARLQDVRRADWDKVPNEDRRRLKYGEYQKIGAKYGTVIVVPILDKHESVIGVVSLDAPPGHHVQLSMPEVLEAVGGAASVVSQLLG